MPVHFLLGGARSGKSSYAEKYAKVLCHNKTQQSLPSQLHYVATATPFDDEMRSRIHTHQSRRGEEWQNHEVPRALVEQIERFNGDDVVLIDCFTLWLNNVIYNEGETADAALIDSEVQRLVQALATTPATIFCVSNEVGLGIVPLGEITRLYVDHAGWMNQAVAEIADTVTFMAAGLPLAMKGKPLAEEIG